MNKMSINITESEPTLVDSFGDRIETSQTQLPKSPFKKELCQPELWTRDDVEKWLKWCSNEYAIHDIPINKFEMNGKALCLLTEEMFKQRAPDNGDILFRALKNLIRPTDTVGKEEVFKNSDIEQTSESGDTSSEICSKNTHNNNNKQDIAQARPATTDKSALATNKSSIQTESSQVSALSSPPFQSTSPKPPPPATTSVTMKPQSQQINKCKQHNIHHTNSVTSKADSLKQLKHCTKENDNNNEPALDKNAAPVFEKKRTANLENLIGNIKVRKLNQTPKITNNELFPNNNEKQMTSLYVDIVHAARSSLSDCSPQSPILSSPSVSPSSESIQADSPAHTSPTSSSSSLTGSNNNNKSRYSMVNPKFRWIVENNSETSNVNTAAQLLQQQLGANQELLESFKHLDSAKIKELINNVMPWCNSNSSSTSSSQDLENQAQMPAAVAQQPEVKKTAARFNGKKCNYNNVKPVGKSVKPDQSLNNKTNLGGNDMENISNLKYTVCPTSKNQEDPTRQIKFYDDFIDFRGDILRRPPDSKNCRILWEYLYLLLQNSAYASVIRWEDESQMVFRIVQAEKLAALWGLQKNRLGMTYEKLSRGMRYYYPNNIIAREAGRRLLYRFMRHPNEIKKFVKKNGTYMLKRAKMGDKSGGAAAGGNDIDVEETESLGCNDQNPEDSSIDESFYENPTAAGSKNKSTFESISNHSKKFVKSEEEEEDLDTDVYGNYEEEEEEPELEEATTTTTNIKVEENNNQVGNQLSFPALNQTNNLSSYPDLYSAHEMFQYYQATNYFSKLMSNNSQSKDELNAAQFLMQLRNQAEQQGGSAGLGQLDPASNQFLQETIKNFASSINLSNSLAGKAGSIKKEPMPRSNDLSSSSSTSSASSKSSSSNNDPNSVDNMLFKNSFKSNYNYSNIVGTNNNQRFSSSYFNQQPVGSNNSLDHPLNLSLNTSTNNNNNNNNSNKKRKSKNDI